MDTSKRITTEQLKAALNVIDEAEDFGDETRKAFGVCALFAAQSLADAESVSEDVRVVREFFEWDGLEDAVDDCVVSACPKCERIVKAQAAWSRIESTLKGKSHEQQG